MNFYVRYFNDETLVNTVDEVIDFLSNLDDLSLTAELIKEIKDYCDSKVQFPKRCKVRNRMYFIIIKTEAKSMQDFKEKKALRSVPESEGQDMDVFVEKEGWYECSLAFKRVVVNHNGKCEYRDTLFSVRCKGTSPKHCYDRMIGHLQNRVDSRSQFPSVKGKSFTYKYLGKAKVEMEEKIDE